MLENTEQKSWKATADVFEMLFGILPNISQLHITKEGRLRKKCLPLKEILERFKMFSCLLKIDSSC